MRNPFVQMALAAAMLREVTRRQPHMLQTMGAEMYRDRVHRSTGRTVAMDKRDARKARNRARQKARG